MALIMQRTVFRGVLQSTGRCLNQQRLLHFTPPQATAAEGAKEKKPVVGKQVLAQRLCETHSELKIKQATEIIDTLLDDIMLSVAEGETVTIPGFGTFKKRHRAARKGRNPTTGAELDIPAKDAPAFSAGTAFKGVVQTGTWEAYDALVAQQKADKAAKAKK